MGTSIRSHFKQRFKTTINLEDRDLRTGELVRFFEETVQSHLNTRLFSLFRDFKP